MRVKNTMLENPKYEVYVPIDNSDLKSIIPDTDDLLYSTECKGIYTIPGGNRTLIVKWNTHVLLTSGGMAYTFYGRKKNINYEKRRSKR